MSLVVEFTVPTHSFVLRDALDAVPNATVTFDRQVPLTGTQHLFVWVAHTEFDAFERAIAADPSVEDLVRLDRTDRTTDTAAALYSIRWSPDELTVVDGLDAGNAALLAAERSNGRWSLTVRFDSRDALVDFRVYCNRHDLDFELTTIVENSRPQAAQYDLSTPQYDALIAALEMGYFNIPRDTTLGEVADQFGISTHAASERLRRGQTSLIATALSVGRHSSNHD